ncbi:MAG: type III secretion system chaperone [Candidatus Methylacidiphilales bacterium]
MPRENLDVLLEKFGRIMEVDLSLGTAGHTVVKVDERIDLVLSFEPDSQSLVLIATCGTLPHDHLLPLLQEILDANFHWAGSGGATLATNSQQGKLYLQYREPIQHMDERRLQELLTAIVHNATIWADRLEQGHWKEAESSHTAADSLAHFSSGPMVRI